MAKVNSVRVGTKGRVVLPPEAREALGVDEGDDLIAIVRDHEVVLMSKDAARALIRSAFADGPNPVDALLAERRAEVGQELADGVDASKKKTA